MKKLYFSTILMIITFPATASFFYYAGGAGGMVNYSADINQNSAEILEFASPPPAITMIPSSGHIKESTIAGQLQFGLGYKHHHWYLAAEASGQFSDGDIGEMSPTFALHMSPFINSIQNIGAKLNSFELAVDLKPGFYLSPRTLVYGRVGAAFNELEVHQSFSFQSDEVNVHDIASISESDNVVGLRLGLGVEHNIYDELTIFLDYVYTQYPDESLNFSQTLDIVELGVIANIDNNFEYSGINKQSIMLGFNYYWDEF